MVASLLTKQESTAKAWVNAGKVDSVEEYYAQIKGTSVESQFVSDPIQQTHEEQPRRTRTRRKKQ
tara:strand:+ start:433 stop:627 length:195 start_codon:yes stop_codon:yes gene_type:complete